MKKFTQNIFLLLMLTVSCSNTENMDIDVYETSKEGNSLTKLDSFPEADKS